MFCVLKSTLQYYHNHAYNKHDYDSIVEWISEHKTLAEDFEMYFGIDIDDL